MYSRSFGFFCLAALLLSVVTGCKKSADTSTGPPRSANAPQSQAQSAPLPGLIARVHWLGINRLSGETNAAYFMTIWKLSETAQLEAQTLDKLASAIMSRAQPAGTKRPGVEKRLPDTNSEPRGAISANDTTNPLRSLLQDLLDEESYLEIRAETNQPGELALAIRLRADHALLWQTNLATALESLTGTRPTLSSGQTSGWHLDLATGGNQFANTNAHPQLSPQPLAFSLQPFHGWTLLGLSTGTNSTLADLQSRIARTGSPFEPSPTNFWLDGQAQLPRVAQAFALKWKLPDNCPKVTMTILGDGQDVRTHGQLHFPRPLPLELEPWNIPTNLVHDPLIGFTALRGFRPWLDAFKPWKDLNAGTTPNQAYIWDQEGLPAQQYCAAPLAQASNLVLRLSERLQQVANPWLQAERIGQLQKSTNCDGVVWSGAPFVSPQLRSTSDAQGQFVIASLIPLTRTNLPPPPELLGEISSRTNLLYYDWEITGQGLDHWLYLAQLWRFLTHHAQLPTDSASFAWFKAIAPKLRNCVTVLSTNAPNQLDFTRKSSLGFDSIELHLLTDWLESPKFPSGLHTFLAPPTPSTPAIAETNSTPKIR